MAKLKRKKRPEPTPIIGPTPEQASKGTFARLTIAYRRIAVIDTMAQTGKLTARQFNGLARYRDVAVANERSLIEDSVGKMMRGALGGGEIGKTPSMLRHKAELDRLDTALGPLRDITHAIAVDDTTVSQWASRKGGTTQGGKPKRAWLETSMMEIKAAGDRLAREIGA